MSSMQAHDVRPNEVSQSTGRFRLVLLALSLVGAALILYSTRRYGAALTSISVGYVSEARSLAQGKGPITTANWGGPAAPWPPLYPILLASASLVTHLDPLTCASFVNAVLFAAVIWLSGLLFSVYVTRSRVLAVLGSLAVLVSRPLVNVSVTATAEPLFISCVLLFLVSALSYTKGANTASLIAIALSAAAASLARFAGIFVIPVGMLLILFRSGMTRKTRILHVLSFLMISAGPFAAWLTWLYLLVGGLGRHMPASSDTLPGLLNLVVGVVSSWFARSAHGRLGQIRILSEILLGAAFAAASFIFLRRRGMPGLRAGASAALRRADPLLLFVVLYTTFLVATNARVAQDPIGDRYLSPIFVPVMVLMFGLLDRSIALVRAVPFGRYLRVGLLLAVAIWLQEPAFDVGLAASKRGREGAGGYNTVRWRESQTIEFVKHLSFSAERVIYTNDPDAIYILAHLAARLPPRKTYFRSSEPARSISDFTGSWPEEGEGLLVWFPHEGRENFFAPSELQSIATLDTLALLQDGAVYSVSARK